MKKILVIGSMNMDLVTKAKRMPQIGETVMGTSFFKMPGGKGANQAVAIARLEGQVSFIGKVGKDDFGKELVKNIKENKICSNGIIYSETETTGMASITVDGNGNNSIIVISGANFDITTSDIDNKIEMLSEADIVVLQLEIPLETVKYIIKKARELNKIIVLNPAPALKLEPEIIRDVDFIIPNETELGTITGIKGETIDEIKGAAMTLIELGAKNVIVTLGEKGSLFINKDGAEKFDSYRVNAVDTTAAGDSFIGGFISFYAGITDGAPKEKGLWEAIKFGAKAGALTVTKYGAQSSLPVLGEVINFEGETVK